MGMSRGRTLLGLLSASMLLAGGCGTAVDPGPQSTPSATVQPGYTATQSDPTATKKTARSTATPLATPTIMASAYTQEEIDYFLELALGAEYGDVDPRIIKWVEDVRIEVLGTPTAEDIETLNKVVEEINQIIESIEVEVVEQESNVQVHFAREAEFSTIEPEYVPGNAGFFWVLYNDDYELYDSTVLIATDTITQEERSHLIREEVTQSLGLTNDSDKYRDSIFFEEWTETSSYSELDKRLIELLYREDIEPGMTADEVMEVLHGVR